MFGAFVYYWIVKIRYINNFSHGCDIKRYKNRDKSGQKWTKYTDLDKMVQNKTKLGKMVQKRT